MPVSRPLPPTELCPKRGLHSSNSAPVQVLAKSLQHFDSCGVRERQFFVPKNEIHAVG